MDYCLSNMRYYHSADSVNKLKFYVWGPLQTQLGYLIEPTTSGPPTHCSNNYRGLSQLNRHLYLLSRLCEHSKTFNPLPTNGAYMPHELP